MGRRVMWPLGELQGTYAYVYKQEMCSIKFNVHLAQYLTDITHVAEQRSPKIIRRMTGMMC